MAFVPSGAALLDGDRGIEVSGVVDDQRRCIFRLTTDTLIQIDGHGIKDAALRRSPS